MADLIKPTKVHVVTKDGECQVNITIDLNINLSAGTVDFQSAKTIEVEKPEGDDDKTVWAIPTFKNEDKVKFGKRKEQE